MRGVDVDDARRDRKVALRIEIDQQHAFAGLLQGGTQIQGAGGLAHPTLLIGYRDDRHAAASLLS